MADGQKPGLVNLNYKGAAPVLQGAGGNRFRVAPAGIDLNRLKAFNFRPGEIFCFPKPPLVLLRLAGWVRGISSKGEGVATLHEYTLMEQVIVRILAELQKPDGPPGGSSLNVTLKVGALAVHSEAATRQAYEVLTKGTPLENSRLNLTIEPVILTCGQCGFSGPLPEGAVDPHDLCPLAECPRCGALSPVQGGRGVEQIELRWAEGLKGGSIYT